MRSITVLKDTRVGYRPNANFQALEGFDDFADTPFKGYGNGGKASGMIDGAKRFQLPAGAGGQQAVGSGDLGSRDEVGQKGTGDQGKVAGEHQVPIRRSMAERRLNAGKRPRAGKLVRDYREPERRVAGRVAYQHYGTRGSRHGSRYVFDERSAAQRQQRFITAHAGAFASHQDEPGPAHGSLTEMMIPSASDGSCTAGQGRIMEKQNRAMRICFYLAGLGALAAGLQGASPSRPERPSVTSVVHSDHHTGRLIRSIQVQGSPSPVCAKEERARLEAEIERIALENQLPAPLVHSVVEVESNYNPFAVSSKGALGLMQLVPDTARRFGVEDVFDPVENMRGGARYLRYLIDLYGDYRLALAAYNAGEGAVARYGGVPPYSETRGYIRNVWKAAEKRAAQPASRQEPETATAKSVPAANPIEEVVGADGKVYYVTRPAR